MTTLSHTSNAETNRKGDEKTYIQVKIEKTLSSVLDLLLSPYFCRVQIISAVSNHMLCKSLRKRRMIT